MAAKKIKTVLKVVLKAGEATPAPPLGPILGQQGLDIMSFVKAYNDATADKKGQIIPAEITVYEDRTYDFVTKLPPASSLIMKALKIEKGSGESPRKIAGELTDAQLTEIAKEKMGDLNTDNIEQAKKVIAGTARSMGVKVKE